MKVESVFSTLSFLAALTVSNAQVTGTATVTYDTIYDNASTPLSELACAQWAADNNLQTLGDVPNFPLLGGAPFVANGNTGKCGQCFSVTDQQTGETIFVTAVDAATNDFVISFVGLNTITSGQAAELGSIQAVIDGVEVSSGPCTV